jgi:lysophospholipase L1-like esterase
LGTGCQNSATIKTAGRTDEQRQALIKPGMFGNGAPADRLRGRFDFWNEEVIRQDVAVGTVFFGDSITELWELDAYFVPSDGVIINRGIGGDITPHMLRRFDADVIQLKPRNVVILAGTNDVARMLGDNKSDEEIITAVVGNLEAMMKSARAAGVNVFICSILPTNPDTKPHEGKARIVPKINKQLESLCTTHGCIYVDYASALADEKGELRKDLANDGLHPHYAGYEIMARVVGEAAKRSRSGL